MVSSHHWLWSFACRRAIDSTAVLTAIKITTGARNQRRVIAASTGNSFRGSCVADSSVHDERGNDDGDMRPPTLIGELWDFLRHSKKWWLLPIVIVLLVFGVLIFLSGTG